MCTLSLHLYHNCMDNVCTIQEHVVISKHRFRSIHPNPMCMAGSYDTGKVRLYCQQSNILCWGTHFLYKFFISSHWESLPLMLPGVTQCFHISGMNPQCTVQFVGIQWVFLMINGFQKLLGLTSALLLPIQFFAAEIVMTIPFQVETLAKVPWLSG